MLSIRERAREVRDEETRKMIGLPGETIGQMLVFRVFDSISYGLIVRATKAGTGLLYTADAAHHLWT